MTGGSFTSWGRYPRVRQEERYLAWADDPLPSEGVSSYLPVGQGRSYGDSCLNHGGAVVHNRLLDRLVGFDEATATLTCEAGVTLAQILEWAVPRGYFLPVSPGTKFVSVAGAVANDVHGKNHHRAGTFGRFVPRIELLRSNGSRAWCSETDHPEIYRATVGGLGLTGFITRCDVRLKRIPSPFIAQDSIRFRNLDEFFSISEDASSKYEYSVSWLDCVSSGEAFGRGIFMGGNHAEASPPGKTWKRGPIAAVPFDAPGFLLGNPTMKLFNTLYYNKQRRAVVSSVIPYEPFFYPLDVVHGWNKLYGRAGFFQFQCVVDREGIRDVLRAIVGSGAGSFLAVLKEFGDVSSPGILSFPKPGVTLALDFANRGAETIRLLRDLDRRVRDLGGRLYPAKDATMAPESFRAYFPRAEEVAAVADPLVSSSFWRRVNR